MADKRLRVDITAKDRTRAAFSRVQRSLGALKKSLFNIKALIGAAFGALAVRAISRFVTKAVDAADAIAKTSRAIGITSDKLQELRFAADISGISMATLDSAMLGFSKRVGEARAGTGTLFTILNKTDQALLANVQSAGSVDEAFDLITQAANRMGNEMDKSALLSAAFGRTAGTAFKNLVPDIERLSQEARDLGLVIDATLLRKAEETKDKLTVLGNVLTTKFHTAVIENAEAIDRFADALMNATRAIANWVADMGPAETASIESLNRRIMTLRNEIDHLTDSFIRGNQLRLENFVGPEMTGFGSALLKMPSVTAQVRALREELEALERIRAKRIQAEEMLSAPTTHDVIEEDPAVKIKREMEARHELNLVLTETPLLNRKWSKAMAEATREAEAQEASIRDLSRTIETTLIDSLADLSTGFKDWRDVARAALRDVIRSMLQFVSVQAQIGAGGSAAGGGFIGGILQNVLGNMFGPSKPTIDAPQPSAFGSQQSVGSVGVFDSVQKRGFQSGGLIAAGQPAIVGEVGPELFVPRVAGQVVPNHALGGSVTVNQTINLSTGVQATVRAEVMGMLPQIAATTKSAVLSARVRGGAFASAFEG